MKKITILSILALLALFSSESVAQIEFGGTIDVQALTAGKDANFVDTGVPEDFRHFHFGVAQLNLLGFAPINDKFFVETRLGFTSYGTGKIEDFKLILGSLTYQHSETFSLTAGRFITPFGFYGDRQLVIDRTFVDLPLNYTYFTNISSELGLIGRKFRYNNSYGDSLDSQLSTVFYEVYNTGLRFDWQPQGRNMLISGALTNQAISQFDLSNNPSYGGSLRIRFTPSATYEWALSAAHGTYFNESELNASIQGDVNFQELTQTSLSLYNRLQFTYFEIVGEAMFTNWKSPVFQDTLYLPSATPFIRDGSGKPVVTDVQNIGANVDLKYEPPSMTGTYFAIRAEYLSFFEIDNPVNGDPYQWDLDLMRYNFGIGHKFSRNVVAKLVFTDQDKLDFGQFTFRAYITAAF